MSERAFELAVVDYAAARGYFARKMSYVGRRGCPDRFFFGHGRIVIIEFKVPGGRLHPLQASEHRRYAAAGVTVHVVMCVEQAEAIFS